MSNYSLGDMVSSLRVAAKARYSSVYVLNTKLSLAVLELLYKQGLIRHFFVENEKSLIIVYLKYYSNCSVFFDIQLISSPGSKVHWSLSRLSLNYNLSAFGGFYMISTPSGLMTSTDCLLNKHVSGLVLLKVSV